MKPTTLHLAPEEEPTVRKHLVLRTPVFLAFLLLGVLVPGSVRAGFITYHVNVDTSSLSGQAGNLDFQFNPGDATAESATATVTNFQSVGGILASSNTLSGDASGLLPGTLTLVNDTPFNDVFQGFTFGSSLGYDLTLTGMALDNPGGTFGSSFAFSLFDAAGVTPLLTTDPNGSVLTVNVNTNGTTSVETFPQSPTNSAPAASAIPAASATPEPSSMVLLLSALPAGFAVLRRVVIRGRLQVCCKHGSRIEAS